MMDKKDFDKKRYEREIEEILEKFDQDSERKGKAERAERAVPHLGNYPPANTRQPARRSFSLSNWRRLSAGQYIAAAFAVALLAVFVRGFSSVLATILVLVSVALFIVPIFLFRSTGTTSGGWSSQEQKRWRGQVIDFNTRRDITNDDPLAAIKRWFKRR